MTTAVLPGQVVEKNPICGAWSGMTPNVGLSSALTPGAAGWQLLLVKHASPYFHCQQDCWSHLLWQIVSQERVCDQSLELSNTHPRGSS